MKTATVSTTDPRCPKCGERNCRITGDKARCLACLTAWNWRKPMQIVKTKRGAR